MDRQITNNFKPHEINWTPEAIGRLWDYYAANHSSENAYFSNKVGDAIIKVAEHYGADLKGRVLDFGCGPGYLLKKLIARGVKCEGIEYSFAAAEAAEKRLAGNRCFNGVTRIEKLPSELESECFDVVFLIETLEHLSEPNRDLIMSEIGRILKPGGMLIATVPNKEPLEYNKIMCPECGCTFHKKQHMSSWSRNRLVEFMGEKGFSTVNCRARLLPRASLLHRMISLARRVIQGKKPHLVYIGRKD